MDNEQERVLKELEWKSTTDKIIKAVDSLGIETDREKMIKIAVEYVLIKMCESEEIFNNDIEILDEYAINGRKHQKVKSLGSFSYSPRRF